MLRTFLRIAGVITLPFAVALLGCSKAASPSSSGKPTATVGHESADHGDAAPEGEHVAEIAAALAALSPEDRALVEKQKICPVSGELLGLMGAPVKLDVKGQPVFICCEGCKDKILSKPDEYLAKLKK